MYKILLTSILAILTFNVFSQLKEQEWIKTKFDETKKEVHFFQILENELYVVTSQGIYKYENTSHDWSLASPISPVTTIASGGNNLYLGLLVGGVAYGNTIKDLRYLDNSFLKEVHHLFFDKVLYICTREGLFIYNVDKGLIEKSLLKNLNIHHQSITKIASVGDYLYAFGCEFIYFKKKNEDDWNVMDFKHPFCVADTWVENDLLYFSTTGDGIYMISTPERQATKLETSRYHPNVQKIKFRNGKLFRLYHNLIIEAEDLADFSLTGDFVTDIADFNGKTFIATAHQGIYSIPQSQNRNKHETKLSVFPNPSAEKVSFCLKNPSSDVYTIAVSDLSGKLVFQKTVSIIDPSIHCEELLIRFPGEYILQCTSKDKILQRNFIITR